MHVYCSVWCVCDRVYAKESTWHLVNRLRNSFDIVDCAENVRCVRASEQLGLATHELAEQIRFNLWILLITRFVPLKRAITIFRELDPTGDVGFMVKLGDDDLITSSDVFVQ